MTPYLQHLSACSSKHACLNLGALSVPTTLASYYCHWACKSGRPACCGASPSDVLCDLPCARLHIYHACCSWATSHTSSRCTPTMRPRRYCLSSPHSWAAPHRRLSRSRTPQRTTQSWRSPAATLTTSLWGRRPSCWALTGWGTSRLNISQAPSVSGTLAMYVGQRRGD